ncbi:MAG TPA: glycoside hydrolase family 20 zincin-like fold domain-containing protein [Bryobacteraceae bacterium]|nr:glycoside hydrolase family 20 zincin-like fold domain-containing protein [Bryobacteraceae bacterium]
MSPKFAALVVLATAHAMDLNHAVIVAPAGLELPEQKAAAMLADEIEHRTRIRLPIAERWPGSGPAIFLGRERQLRGMHPMSVIPPAAGADGYRIQIEGNAIAVLGNDARGTLFGAGALLRRLHMERDRIEAPDSLRLASAPKYALRGHQLGYRPKTNSYDGWSVPVWEQYIRDLVVFGTNAIELIPPRSDDAADSPHFPLPPMQMMIEMSRLASSYGLDVWIWYPAMDPDYSDPKTVESALHEWGEVFRQLPSVDAVFVPGGDPGHTQPKVLLALLEKQTEVLHRYHPHAQMWVSPQSFDQAWLDEFLGILKTQQPAWLSGVVFGPQIRISLKELRAAVPQHYPIRHYPDVTHSRQSQYPVPDWDLAYAVTEAREVINPRPLDEANIFRLIQPYTIGSITYSEGCNDDVNKMIWSSLGWNPDADVTDILHDYGRYLIGEREGGAFAQGLLALERNWRGPLAENRGVYATIQLFQTLERTASPQLRSNWRFQQALYRAYYDAYTRARLIFENGLEERALADLKNLPSEGSLAAMDRAEATLATPLTDRNALAWRARVFELAEALFQSIRMQLSVPRYQAISVDRGANLDTIDVPLNNRGWLRQRFDEIRRMPDEAARRNAIDAIVNWTDPGPGGFYDDLGNPARQPHLVRGPGYQADPDFRESALTGFAGTPAWRTSWRTDAETLYETPLRMHYDGLDPAARYKLRVVYAGDSPRVKIRLVANGTTEIHPLIERPAPIAPLEFDIPQQTTEKGTLDLSWYRGPGQGGNGRGCQVAEVWLIRK